MLSKKLKKTNFRIMFFAKCRYSLFFCSLITMRKDLFFKTTNIVLPIVVKLIKNGRRRGKEKFRRRAYTRIVNTIIRCAHSF